jgi:hypothetical protein
MFSPQAQEAFRRRVVHAVFEQGRKPSQAVGVFRVSRMAVIPGTGQRFGCNRISMVTNRGTLRCLMFQKRFARPVLLSFPRRLLHSVKGKMFLILDGHPAQQGKLAQRWLAAQQGRITLFYPTGDSSELNPDELLNCDVKSHAGRRRTKDKMQMIESLRGHLRGAQKQPAKVRRYFHQKHVAHAAG